MKSFAILVDSTADTPRELREKHGIDYMMMNYVWNEKEYTASLDWEERSPREFYDIMRKGGHITTTQVPRERIESKFTELAESGSDILYIGCSSALSGSINLGRIVAKEMKEKYPDTEIYCLDSLCSSLGQAMIALMASYMRTQGKSLQETVDFVENNKLKVNQYGTVDSLEYLRRAGRVKASSAFFGNLFGVKPIVISDVIGQNYAIKKVKGALNAKEEIASLVAAAVENPEQQTLFISHADFIEDAELLKEAILRKAPFKDVYISYIGPIVGASVGPGTIISFCYGTQVTIEGKD